MLQITAFEGLKKYKEPVWGPVGREVYERTYKRIKKDGTDETWRDTVERVIEGNTGLVSEQFIEPTEREKLFDLIYEFKMLPAGRHLWCSGVPGRQFLFNCHRAGFTERLADHYGFAFDQLMQGGGVGANYSNRYIKQYGLISAKTNVHIVCDSLHSDYHEFKDLLSDEYSSGWDGCIRIDDSREGWVEALESVINSHFDNTNSTLVFDVSLVRARGQRIRGFGGKASGPLALSQMLLAVNSIINSKYNDFLTSLDHMSIDHEIAKCVVAGNVRRSARMSIKSWKDSDIFDFINCKKEHMNHWSTNISVEIDDDFFKALKAHDKFTIEVYKAVVEGMLTNGEPGFYNLSLAQDGELGDVGSTNPCGEIALEPWENCNLGHINLSAFADDFEGSKEAFRLMTRFLIRASFGDIPNEKQRAVVDRNRRIGVGFFGFQGWLVQNNIRYSDSHRNRYVRKTFKDWKLVVDKEKSRYAFKLRIPEPIKGTTVAPTGSIAKLSGDTEGMQPVYGRYFIRRIRFADNDSGLGSFVSNGYETEPCQYTPNTTVVSFICKDPLIDRAEEALIEQANEVSLADMLAVQAMVQECYADNAISFTVNVEPDRYSVEDAMSTIIHYLPHLKGTTIMPNGSRPQAPYELITKEEYESATIKSTGNAYDECSSGACPIR